MSVKSQEINATWLDEGQTTSDGLKITHKTEIEYTYRLMKEAEKIEYGTNEAVFEERCPKCANLVRYIRDGSIWGYRCDTPGCFSVRFYGL